MRRPTRQYVLLVVALLAFAGMVVLVATGVTLRRQTRDFTFGLEELDVLIEDRAWDEAASMVPWLAQRATTAGDALRILRRAHQLYTTADRPGALYESARTLLDEFPANETIRTIAVYAAVRDGRPSAGLELAGERLVNVAPEVYAWTLLATAARAAPHEREEADPIEPPGEREAADEMLLVGLDPSDDPVRFERAWRLTGDERYALDGVLLSASSGNLEVARELSTQAGIATRWPLVHAGLLVDTGRFEPMIPLLERHADEGDRFVLLLADAYLRTGRDSEALGRYDSLLRSDAPPAIAFVNAAALVQGDTPDAARAILERGLRTHPDSYAIARAAAILATGAADTDTSRVSLERWFQTEHAPDARLLTLRLSSDPDARHFSGEIWRLIERYPTDDVLRFAAWYFASRDQIEDLVVVLDARARTDLERAPPGWVSFYNGYIAARRGIWGDAVTEYERSFVATPTWQAAHNAAIALYRTGDQAGGDGRVQDALLLARHNPGADRVRALLLGARASRDAAVRRRLVDEALSIEPANPEALLLRTQLDNPSTR